MEHRYGLSEKVLASGILLGVITAIFWGATNCSWWDHSFCTDSSFTNLIAAIYWILGGSTFLLFFAGGIAREINMEGRLPAPEVDNEMRREYHKRAITRKPLLPNIMIVLGLILIFGVSSTLLGTFLNWTLGTVGIVLVIVGFYFRRKKVDSWKTKPGSAHLDHSEA